MTVRFKALVNGCFIPWIAASSPDENIDVYLLCLLCVVYVRPRRQADCWFRGVLPGVRACCVCFLCVV